MAAGSVSERVIELLLGADCNQEQLVGSFTANARRLLGEPYERYETGPDGETLIFELPCDIPELVELFARLDAAGWRIDVGERSYRIAQDAIA
jgi:hypothetical protein